MNDDTATDVTGVSPSAGHTTGPAARTPRQHDPSIGELQLEERSSLRRVGGLSTELQDINDAEYRALRLERVVLVGVWTEGSAARADARSEEHTSELQSRFDLVCRLRLEKKKTSA